MQEIAVTDHAVARYRERVRPALSLDDAEEELLRVLSFGVFSDEGPLWRTAVVQNIVGWVFLGDGIAFPLVRDDSGLVAVTCLVRGGSSEDASRVRRERKARRRNARRLNVDDKASTRRRREAA